MAILYIYPHQGASWKREIDKDVLSIGRGPANDIPVADPSCSSRHASIERSGGGFLLRDAGSKNGTFLNKMRITCPVGLAPGDKIDVGSTTVTFDRPRMPQVTMVDAPGSATGPSAVVPFREILDQSSVSDAKTSQWAVPADLAEENRILQALVRVGDALGAHKPVQELLEDILSLVADIIPMDQCVIMLGGKTAGALETRAARLSEAWGKAREILISRTIVSMAYDRHLSVLFSATAPDPGFDPTVSIIEKGIRSALCVPIGDDEEVIGVLYADRHSRTDPFKDADLRLLTLMAKTAAVKIQEARRIAALIDAQKAKHELKIAAEIQRDFLPRSLPSCEGFGMAGRAVPCLEVGGDYYDAICFEGQRLGLAVADVSGKGVGAALLMASLRAWLRAELAHGTALAELAAKLNDFIHQSSDNQSFITFFFAELDRHTGSLRYINAGHNPALVIARDGGVRELQGTGLCLGMLSGRAYEVGAAGLAPGEVLVLYTDGITESRNAQDEEFGVEGLADAVRDELDKDAPDILEAVFRRLAEFTRCAEPLDDRTLVVVKRREFVSAPTL
jgi:sigma-B regulation protein RsbU (phosphoserine phosphatase)